MRMPDWLTNPQRLIIVLVVGAAFLISSVWISRSQDYMVNGDFFESWLAGRALWTGIDMYNPDSWGPAHNIYGNVVDRNAVYPFPPIFALIFAPLGLLPLPAAVVTWVFLSQWFIVFAVIILLRASGLVGEAKYLLPVMAAVFLFRPAMVTLRNGQNGALFLFVLAIVAFLWQRERWFSGGFLLAFFLLRPNIGLTLVGIVGLWLLLTRNWRAIVGIFVGTVCLLLFSELLHPHWIGKWMNVGNDKLFNTFGYHPNLWGFVGWLSGHDRSAVIYVGFVVAIAITAGTAVWLHIFAGKAAPLTALAIAIPVGLWLAPYMWAYDQVLLIFSIVVCTWALVKLGKPYLVPATLHIFISIGALTLLSVAVAVGEDSPSGLLNLLVIGLVCAILRTRGAPLKML